MKTSGRLTDRQIDKQLVRVVFLKLLKFTLPNIEKGDMEKWVSRQIDKMNRQAVIISRSPKISQDKVDYFVKKILLSYNVKHMKKNI